MSWRRPRRRSRRSRNAARLGVPVVTALANGFSETGAEGDAREARLREICAQTGIRLVGPSSLGVVDLRHKTFLTANAAFDEPDLPVGRIFAASHSGGMIGTFLSRGKARGIGFAGLVSVGNEVDLSIGEICAATLDDPGIDGYVLFLETMRKARGAARLRARGGQARQAGAGLQARPLGRGARACGLAHRRARRRGRHRRRVPRRMRHRARRHAGRPDRGLSAAGARAGAAARRAARRRSPWSPPRPAAPPWWSIRWRRAASRSSRRAPQTLARIKAATGVDVAPARIVDLTLAGAQYDVMKGALDVLTTAPEFDLVVVVVGSSARFYPDLAVKPIIDSAGAQKPIAAFLVPEAPDALARLAAAGVPNFHTPEACADAVAAALRRRAPRAIEVRAGTAVRRGRMLDELEAYALLDRLGVPRAPSVALDASVSKAPALPFPYPVAVKALSAADRAQVRCRRRGAQRARRCARCSRRSRQIQQATERRPRAGAADDVRPRRGADRLSRRCRRRPAGHAGGRRHPGRNPSRPQPAARAGRSRRGARP